MNMELYSCWSHSLGTLFSRCSPVVRAHTLYSFVQKFAPNIHLVMQMVSIKIGQSHSTKNLAATVNFADSQWPGQKSAKPLFMKKGFIRHRSSGSNGNAMN